MVTVVAWGRPERRSMRLSDRNARRAEGRSHPSARDPHPQAVTNHDRLRPLFQSRRIQTIPFERMSPRDIEDCDALVASLAQRFRAHMSRRQRHKRRGRLDIRRTIRWSIGSGGVPLRAAFRQRRPGAPDLVGLCDHSYSVATASRFLISLLHPAQQFFRRLRLFAFVDQPVEISIDGGMLVPHGRLDFFARSDFGECAHKILGAAGISADSEHNRSGPWRRTQQSQTAAGGHPRSHAQGGSPCRMAQSRTNRALEHRRQRHECLQPSL